ncbi:MAG: NAD(P)H-dependent oxidoreductase subunit E [Bacillota bacterium]
MIDNRIQVEICIGTPCFLMGGQSLIEELEWLPFKYRSKFIFKASHCIDNHCSQAPVIKVKDKVFENVTPDRLKNILDQFLDREEF